MDAGLRAINSPIDSDEQLMLAYRDGDASAFEHLYARHKQAVYHFFIRQNLPQAVAEELCHDTWLKIINSRENYTVSASFKTYLFTVVRHIAIDYTRKKSTQSETAVEQGYEQTVEDITADNQQLQQALKRQIAALPFSQREAFLLKQEGGFTIEEIATITRQNREAVKSSWRYALQKLRKGLSHYVE